MQRPLPDQFVPGDKMQKRTIAKGISLRGIGLHTGEEVQIRIMPEPSGRGISFYRVDYPEKVWIPGNLKEVKSTSYATTIGSNGTRISTVEHLMSALYGLGVDSALVEVKGPEIPIMDGSALEFGEAIQEAGLRSIGKERRYLKILKELTVEDGQSSITVRPFEGFRVHYTIEFQHPLINRQELELDIDEESFLRLISPARTFGFLNEVYSLRKAGLAKGGSLENAVVLDHKRVLNPEGLRFSDEFVRHKILDFVGDISLLSLPVKGFFMVKRSGHTLNHRFLKELIAKRDHWEVCG